jgi:hypothetical protein
MMTKTTDPYQTRLRSGPSMPAQFGKPIDYGLFCVWFYQRPSGHTKTAARHRGESPFVTEWAYALRKGDAWEIGDAVSGFDSRDAAIWAAKAAIGL